MTINNRLKVALAVACVLPVLGLATFADTSIIGPSDSWKYLDTGDNDLGSTNGLNFALTNWTTVDFDDSSWLAGAQPLGFGDPDIVTSNSFGGDDTNKYVTTYYRKTFQMASLTGVQSLRLNMKIDDGAVVYVNGRCVRYINMTEPINYLALAPTSMDPEETTNYVDISPNVLMVGSNTIAVEVHQVTRHSSDLRMFVTLDQLDLSAPITSSDVTTSSRWYYNDSGVDLGASWSATNYDASSWSIGPSPLGYLKNFQQTNAGTYIDYGADAANRIPTTYFRRNFVVNNPAFVTSVVVNVQMDDGGVVYLNGVVVTNLRIGTPPVPYTNYTTANNGSDGQGWEPVSVSPSMLVAGTNVWAVDVHNVGPASSDLRFSLTSTVLSSPGGLAAIYIDTADQTVTNGVTAIQVDGSNSSFIVGDMMWTNSLGGGGSFMATSPWTIATVPLTVGTNMITVSGTNMVGTMGSDVLTVIRQQLPAFVDITITNQTIEFATTSIDLPGTNGDTIVGTMWWTNTLGGSGTFGASSPWEIPSLSLAEGANVITVYGTNVVGVIGWDSITLNRQTAISQDTDLDALPDSWETRFFGGATNAVASGDADGDGQSNWEEYMAGTLPNDSNSLFMVTYFNRNGTTNEIQFMGGTNGNPAPYAILSTTGSITNSFGLRNGNLPPRTEGTNIYIETSTTTPRFYKIAATN